MSSRHTRRKAAKAKQAEKLIALAQAERSRRNHAIVRANLSASIERNFYPASCLAGIESESHRGYVCHNRVREERR